MRIKKQGRKITFSKAVNEAISQSMKKDKDVFIIGEGVPDPKGIFGTTLGLKKEFGSNRVFDMPVSENALTGIITGASLTGMRPIMTHQRMDFMLYSMDQIVNNASKWRYMFGGQSSVPIVIRTIIGRGWGQGSQHSQNLHALFAHIPGLKVVMPTTAYDAKGLLISSINDNNPVIFIEHRWLHNTTSYVPEKSYSIPIGKAKLIKKGKDITLISHSFMTLEAIKAGKYIENEGFSVEIIDLRTIKPLDKKAITLSVRKTGRAIIIDSGWKTNGLAAEICTLIIESNLKLKSMPRRITLPDLPTPTSSALTRYYYPGVKSIVKEALTLMGTPKKRLNSLIKSIEDGFCGHYDVPDKKFTGPF